MPIQPIEWTLNGIQNTVQLSAGTINTLQTDTDLNCIETSSSYRTVNTLRSIIKSSQLMLCTEIITVCSQINTEYINTLCGAESLNVEF